MKQIIASLLLLLVSTQLHTQISELANPNKSQSYYISKGIKKILFKKNTLLIKGVYIPVSADAESFEVISEEYAKDKDAIYYRSNKLSNGDLSSIYWDPALELPRDKNNIYQPTPQRKKLVAIENADLETYEQVHLKTANCLKWYRDKNHYYYNHKRTTANRKTLSFESEYIPFDDTHVYQIEYETVKAYPYSREIKVICQNIVRDNKKIHIAEVLCAPEKSKSGCRSKSFDVEDVKTVKTSIRLQPGIAIPMQEVQMSFDNKVLYDCDLFEFEDSDDDDDKERDKIDPDDFENVLDNYYRHKKDIFHKKSSSLKNINADAETFKKNKNGFYVDKDKVFNGDKIINGADPKTFTYLKSRFYKDSKKVFYQYDHQFYEVKEADAETFEVTQWRGYAKDKNHVYSGTRILEEQNPKNFKVDGCGRIPGNAEFGKKCPPTSYSRSSKSDDD